MKNVNEAAGRSIRSAVWERRLYIDANLVIQYQYNVYTFGGEL